MTFRELTNILLFEKENYGSIYECLHKLHDFYASITGIAADDTTDKNVYLPTGKAISPGQAAHCLVDVRRTMAFLRGVYKAILDVQAELDGAPVHILYAGCGPYATLLTPITTIFTPQQVRFHLMDVNQQSLTAARTLLTQLNALDYVEAFICADAATYQLQHPAHIVVCEAMQSALAKEPQVSIMTNLIPQLGPNGRFVPHRISIAAYVTDTNQEVRGYLVDGPAPERRRLAEIFAVGRNDSPAFEPSHVEVPADVLPGQDLELFTEIDVYGDERLGVYDCGLTLPVNVMSAGGKGGKTMRFEYEVSETPGFKWQLVN